MSNLIPYNSFAPVVKADNDDTIVDLWLRTKRNPATRSLYAYTVAGFRQFIGCELRGLTLDRFMDYCDELKAYRPATQAQRISTVKSLLSFAQKVGYIPYNVGATVPAPKGKDTLSERILSEEQVIKIILAAAGNPRHELLIRLMYRTAGRVSEIIHATWDDLVLTEDKAQIALFGKGNETRHVTLPADLYHCLQAIREGARGDERIFPVSRQGAWHIVKTLAKKAGLGDKPSPHWFRHSHATHALNRGAVINLVSETLGHSNIAITSKYTHVRPGESSGDYLEVG